MFEMDTMELSCTILGLHEIAWIKSELVDVVQSNGHLVHPI